MEGSHIGITIPIKINDRANGLEVEDPHRLKQRAGTIEVATRGITPCPDIMVLIEGKGKSGKFPSAGDPRSIPEAVQVTPSGNARR